MKIAVIAWGSLMWDLGAVRIKNGWHQDGPMLPVEFARISKDGRLTLVIHPGSAPQRAYWALSEFTDLGEARKNLCEREGCKPEAIPYFPVGDGSPAVPPEVKKDLEGWLSVHGDLDFVIWTGLKTNWPAKRGSDFSAEDALRYIEEIKADCERSNAAYEQLKEYIQKAPPSMNTTVRNMVRRRGWQDIALPGSPFDGHPKPRSLDQIQICRGFGDKQWERLRPHLIDPSEQPKSDDGAWEVAIRVFDRRMRERYLSCIDALERADSRAPYLGNPADAPIDGSTLPSEITTTPGFGIMALCCLLIETLQTFREGEPTQSPPGNCPRPEKCAHKVSGTNKAFREFLTREGGAFRPEFSENGWASKFVNGIRNGVLHQAETRKWVIWRENPSEKTVEEKNGLFILDRSRFCNKLREEYKSYVNDLRDPRNKQLRWKFVQGIDGIVDKCRKLS